MKRWLAMFLVGTGACSGNLSRSDCQVVVDHMIDIFTAPRGDSPGKDLQKASEEWRDKLKADSATKLHLLDTCKKTMTSDHASCVEKATDEKSLAECFAG